MVDFDENLIKIQSVTVKGNLPNPFVMDDGIYVHRRYRGCSRG